jgi:uroporphyrinogen III methyltransferase/synthase
MSGAARSHAVVVTRDEPVDGPLSSKLRDLGLTVLSWPVIRVRAPEDPAPLERALARVGELDWIVFASQHAVAAVAARLAIPPAKIRIAAVGARTAEALREHGWRADVVPELATAAGLVAALRPLVRRGTRALFPASSRALPALASGLTGLGVELEQVEAYHTEAAPLDALECCAWVDREAVAAVTFTSPSTVEELDRALGREHFDRLLNSCLSLALGPTTARALAERGYESVLAHPATLAGLAHTTFQLLQTRR